MGDLRGIWRLGVRSVSFLVPAVLLGALLAPAGLALEPPRPGELARLERAGKLDEAIARAKAFGNHRMSPDLLRRADLKVRRAALGITAPAPPSAWTGLPTTGDVKVLTLLIEFPDYLHKNDASVVSTKLFGDGWDADEFPYESLHAYYERSSYSQLQMGGDVLGWYRPSYNRSSVAQTQAGREALIKEALASYDAGHDFSQYDNDGDGAVDYFVVIWTGPQGDWSTFWWGYQTWFGDSSFILDGKTLDKYSWQWECPYQSDGTTTGVFDPIVVIHETGHALGLPDYYDYDDTVGPDGGVGQLDMMDTTWGDHNAFSKWVLGWLTPQVVTGAPRSVSLAASGTNASALVVMPGASSSDPFKEYFVVQNRQRVGNDSDCVANPYQDLPGDGLLIWHVDARLQSTAYGDDYVYDNSFTAHKLLRLMEADGLEQIETVAGYWVHADDYYLAGDTFGDTTTPNSRRYDGTSSSVSVSSIPNPSGLMTFVAGVTAGVDVVAPVTTAAGYDSAWHTSPVTVTLSATDAGGTGVAYTEYRVDAGGWVRGAAVTLPAPALTQHTYSVDYRSADLAGNVEGIKTCQVRVDRLAPSTSASGADDAWHSTPVTVTFSASDGQGSGLDYTEYQLDDLAWVRGGSVTLPAEPDTTHIWTVKYRSADKAGNVEAYRTVLVRIDTTGGGDTTAPTVEVGGASDDWYYNHDVTLTLTATDEPGGSGVAAIVYELDDEGDVRVAADSAQVLVPAVPNGQHTLVYQAEDQAGHLSDPRVFRITTDTIGPAGSGKSVSGRKGRSVSLRYSFADTYSLSVWRVKVTVKSRRGRVVWSKSLGAGTPRPVGLTSAFKWRPRAKGVFTYQVTCVDSAGNAQSRKASGTVRVR